MNTFIREVANHFNLGDPNQIQVSPLRGYANYLWQFSTPHGKYVIKEMVYDTPNYFEQRQKAAAFEYHVFKSKTVLMPEPIPAITGDFINLLTGSRSQSSVQVRVHHWMDGDTHSAPKNDYLQKAGASLYAVQSLGQNWSCAEQHTLCQWDQDLFITLDRLRNAPKLSSLYNMANPVLKDALQLINKGENIEGDWIFSHRDHKPENTLQVNNQPAIIDWDECEHCHPKLEVVEAAMRWSGDTKPDAKAFATFLDGYVSAGGTLSKLEECDFAKRVSALVSWFSFQSRRALGDYNESPSAQDDAKRLAHNAITSLQPTLNQISTWMKWY